MNKNSKLVKSISAFLAATIIGTTFFAYFRVPAGASYSLSYIEKIKKRNSFSIVEIAPDANAGTMGYYVPGNEPTAVSQWLGTVASMDDVDERTAYAQTLFTRLYNKGVLSGESDAAPLLLTDNYSEHNPWDEDFYIKNGNKYEVNELYKDAKEVYMTGSETYNDIPGAYEPKTSSVTDTTGYDFELDYDYEFINNLNLFNLG